MKNNLFSYATKELSQDAFICWMTNWFNYDSPLSKLSKDFVGLVFAKNGAQAKVETVDVIRQYNHIDVLLIVNKTIAIIIEDKTYTSEHGNQIERYKQYISENKVDYNGNKYDITDVICVYFKTAEYVYADEAVLKNTDIVKICRKEMLSLIKPYIQHSEILADYYDNLEMLDGYYEKLHTGYDRFAFGDVLKSHHMHFRFFNDIFAEGEDPLNKSILQDMSLPAEQPPLQQGTTFGIPYTWYWFKEYSKGVPKEKILTDGKYLGFRIDGIDRPFISLRMYRRYDKKDGVEKANQIKEYQLLKKYISALVEEISGNFKVKINPVESVYNFECEIFRCYFDEQEIKNMSDFNSFAKMLKIVRTGFNCL